MSNELKATVGVTGLTTVVFRLYQGITQVGSDIAATEVASQGGLYAANMPTEPAGVYDVQVLVGGIAKASGRIVWDGTKEVTADATALDNAALIKSVLDGISGNKLITIVDTTTTSGTTAHVKVQMVTYLGELVDLSTVDPDATCTVAVIRDGNVPQFSLDESDMGVPNAGGIFEADFTNPNFTADCGYTVLTTIVANGVTYADRVDNFNVWP